MKVSLSELVVDPTIQIRRSNHEPTIRRYEESFEKLPPVDVFRTPEGLLLSDGFHRTSAAERLGVREIEANLHEGTREDALEFAVIANTKNADPLTPEERDDGIRRLKQLHPDWAERKIAEAMSVSQRTVRHVSELDEVKRDVIAPVTRVKDSHYAEVANAPKEHWEPLVKATEERGWSRDATRLAVKNLKDDRVPAEHRRAILSGEADPVVVTDNGDFAVPADVVSGRISEMAANDAMLAFNRALEALAKARLFRPEAIFGPANRETREHWARELPGDIAFLEEVLAGAKESGAGALRVIGAEEG